ncbi:cytochrome c oxidase-assembly factor cox-23, mitochondrial [Astrocystis sublimbata]|nr:cytochrome c oxidase-assembly factor cox-23, mitochondrial [Astrocystis sublimbata]
MSSPAEPNDNPKDSDPWDQETKRKFQNKSMSEYFDPCQEAATRSIRCLNRNGGDRAMCTDYFEAYRACKKEWINKRKEDKKKAGGFFS